MEGHVPDHAMRCVRERHHERVTLDHGHDRMGGEAPAKAFRQPGVKLDREHAPGRVGERRRQPTGAGANLDHEVGPRDSGRGDHLGGEAGASEKVLPVSEPGAMAATSRGHGTSLCRNPFDPRVYYQTPGTSRAVVGSRSLQGSPRRSITSRPRCSAGRTTSRFGRAHRSAGGGGVNWPRGECQLAFVTLPRRPANRLTSGRDRLWACGRSSSSRAASSSSPVSATSPRSSSPSRWACRASCPRSGASSRWVPAASRWVSGCWAKSPAADGYATSSSGGETRLGRTYASLNPRRRMLR